MKRRNRRLNPIYWTFQFLGGLIAISSLFWIPYLVNMILGGLIMHTVKFWDSKLYRLQKLADSINYHIDSDADYLQICKLLPVSRNKPAPVEILPLFYKVAIRIQSVKNCK